ncbi:MAG: hypothetical protein QNL33_15675 [Akkermansiaceae bacterium]|jgi:hypothetical protein
MTGIRQDVTGNSKFRLFCAVSTTTKDPALISLQHPAAEQETLNRLLNNLGWLKSTMQSRRNDRLAGNQVPPQPVNLFDDRGKPLKQLFRVFENPSDSNFDGKADHLQLADPAAEGNPYDMDIDSDGIPNAYDRDLWPQNLFPDLYARLSNVLINEVLQHQ